MDLTPGEVTSYVTAGVLVFWKLVDFLAARTVKTADEANRKRDTSIEELFDTQSEQQNQINEILHSLKGVTEKMTEVKGLVKEVKEATENSRDKQAEYYREELKKLEINFRQELSKSSSNEALMLVKKLEKELLLLARKKK